MKIFISLFLIQLLLTSSSISFGSIALRHSALNVNDVLYVDGSFVVFRRCARNDVLWPEKVCASDQVLKLSVEQYTRGLEASYPVGQYQASVAGLKLLEEDLEAAIASNQDKLVKQLHSIKKNLEAVLRLLSALASDTLVKVYQFHDGYAETLFPFSSNVTEEDLEGKELDLRHSKSCPEKPFKFKSDAVITHYNGNMRSLISVLKMKRFRFLEVSKSKYILKPESAILLRWSSINSDLEKEKYPLYYQCVKVNGKLIEDMGGMFVFEANVNYRAALSLFWE